ncbi:MAG: hypothetical protein IT337_13485 [Thermomicrobiales bacterium]|nr:hypothetical protein [Thermomicrobiales bacterium]
MSTLAAIPAVALLFVGSVAAQEDATTDATPSRVVNPSECAVEPVSAADLSATLTAEATTEGFTMQIPLGTPADAATTTKVTDTVRQLFACLNGGEYLRGAALATPNGARLLFGGLAAGGPDALTASLEATPTARTEEGYLRVLAITDVSVLADGKIAAFVILNEPILPPRGPETKLFIFQPDGDQLKFDNMISFSVVPPAPAAEGTPTS